MPNRPCLRHRGQQPCTCAMGNLYRFVEPVLLFLIERRGSAYGYELANEVRQHAFTDAAIDGAALYRTLRQLEQNDCVTSNWDTDGSGPARRLYRLTSRGEQHLNEWIVVLEHMSGAISRFVAEARKPAPQRGKTVPNLSREDSIRARGEETTR